MMAVQCSDTGPHGPHRYDRGAFGVANCPGVPNPVDPQLTAREAAALDDADRALDRAGRAEEALDKARLAVRVGDWPALWRALDIPPAERLPTVHAPLDTATGELEPATARLDTEQEIRSWALDAAARIGTGLDAPTVRDLEQTIIGTAERYADWIATGSTEAWDWRPEKSRSGPTTPEASDA